MNVIWSYLMSWVKPRNFQHPTLYTLNYKFICVNMYQIVCEYTWIYMWIKQIMPMHIHTYMMEANFWLRKPNPRNHNSQINISGTTVQDISFFLEWIKCCTGLNPLFSTVCHSITKVETTRNLMSLRFYI